MSVVHGSFHLHNCTLSSHLFVLLLLLLLLILLLLLLCL